MKATRALYPHHRVMAVRHKPGGKRVVLDQSRAEALAGGLQGRPLKVASVEARAYRRRPAAQVAIEPA